MRFSVLLLLIFTSISSLASVDDTLPKGVSSKILAFPFVLRSPETSWGFGAASAFFFRPKKNDVKLRTSDINLIGLYTLKKQVVFVLGSTIFFPNEQKIFRFQGSYSYYPDKFWGLGNETSKNDREDYSLKQLFFNPQLIFKLYRNLFIGGSFELQNVEDFSYVRGGIFDVQEIPGREGGLAAGAGLLLTWDNRNNAYSPNKGVFAELNFTRFDKKLGSRFSFISSTLDLRKFISIGKSRTLGLQSFTRLTSGDTPIRYLSMLGGTEIMRGYYKGRYTDLNLAAFQAEIRQYLFWRLGVAAFAGIGQVGGKFADFGIDDFHFSYGAGIRILVHEKEKLNLRVDLGFGKNSSGAYVILKEAF